MRKSIEYPGLKWVDIVNPGTDDINYLESEFNIHPVILKNIIPSIMHPDFKIFQDYLSLVLHYPKNEDGGQTEIYELDVIAGKNFVITNHYKFIKHIDELLEKCKSDGEFRKKNMQKGSGVLLLIILNDFLARIMEKVDAISQEISSLEKGIFTKEEGKLVQTVSYLKRRIIVFWRAIEPQGEVFASLKTDGAGFFGQEYKHYFSNLYSTYKRIENTMKTNKETIESLEETVHNMVNLKRNDIIKILTIFSVILMPLTFLASIWGMNTNFLPFMDSESDFWAIALIMAAVLGGMLFYFKYKKWL